MCVGVSASHVPHSPNLGPVAMTGSPLHLLPGFYLLWSAVQSMDLHSRAHRWSLTNCSRGFTLPCQGDCFFAWAAGNPDSRRLSRQALKAPLSLVMKPRAPEQALLSGAEKMPHRGLALPATWQRPGRWVIRLDACPRNK